MILVVGLGNPGNEYKNTRHNVGFMLIDEILKTGGFSELGSSKFQGELFKKGSLLLLKPQTFMNLSGNSVKAVNDFYKPERIIVIHDDIDLELGAVKFKKGGGSGGHNGIGRDGRDAASFVLSKFTSEDAASLIKILAHAKAAVEELLRSDIGRVAQKFSTKKVAS